GLGLFGERVPGREILAIAEDRTQRLRYGARRRRAPRQVLVDTVTFERRMHPLRPPRVAMAVAQERPVFERAGLGHALDDREDRWALLAPRDRQIIPARGSGIELTRSPDLLVGILDHFLPLRDPADRARDREQDSKHRSREPHRLEGDAGIEVDVRVELLLDEIVVVQRDALE